MTLIAIILVFVVFLFVYHKKEKPEPKRRVYVDVERKALSRHFRIAGISFKCSIEDIGIITGKVRYDPTNEHDPNAIAIVSNADQPNEKIVGFISKQSQIDFKNFADKEKELPFVGFIEEFDKEDGRGIYGKIKVYYGKEEDIDADMADDIIQLKRAFRVRLYDERAIMLDQW